MSATNPPQQIPPATNRRTPPDELIRTLTPDGGVSVRVVVATGLVREAEARHQLAPTAAGALGRALMGAVLLAVGPAQGQDETVQLHFRGDGPLGTMTAISDPLGRVRGRVANPSANPPLEEGQRDIAGAVGRGVLTVVRQRPSWRVPHSGMVPLVTGEVAKDITHYLASSEQVPSAVGLRVTHDERGRVEVAGGFIVQALPGVADAVLATIEANVLEIQNASDLLAQGIQGDRLLDQLLHGVGGSERSRIAPRFHCSCDRERAVAAAALLGRETVREIVLEGGSEEVRCEFCGERYVITADELGAQFPDS